MKYILSYGGGVNSTAMLVFLIKNNKPLDLVQFADTGGERNYTYDSVNFYEQYCKDHGVPFVRVDSGYNKSLYEYNWDKKIVPSRWRRDCTAKFKIRPMRRFARQHFGKKESFVRYIGIDHGESHRMADSDRKYETNSYPLVDNKMNRQACKDYLESQDLPVPKKSGCYFCILTPIQGWIQLDKERPDLYESAMALEQNAERYPKDKLSQTYSLLQIRIFNTFGDWGQSDDPEISCKVAAGCFT